MDAKLIKSVFTDDPDIVKLFEDRENRAVQKEILKELLAQKQEQAEIVDLKFLKGEKGDSPTEEELLSLITPLIPEPIKGDGGHTPTNSELRALIKPLIPSPEKGDPGKDATPIHETIYKTETIREEVTINEDVVKQILAIMAKLPEKDRLDVSALRNASSFMYNGKRYKTEELMHGGGSGTGGTTTIYSDTVSGTIDGVNKTFTVSNTITTPIALWLANSIYQPTVDFSTSGTTITMVVAPDASLAGQPFWLSHI